MICICRQVEGDTLALQHGSQNYFLLVYYLVKCLIVMLRCALNVTTSSFQHFPVKFKCKIFVLKDVILNFKNHISVT